MTLVSVTRALMGIPVLLVVPPSLTSSSWRAKASIERLEKHGRIAVAAIRPKRVIRDDTAALPSPSGVETFGITSGHGVEYQQGLTALKRRPFGGLQEPSTDTGFAKSPSYQHLRDISPMRLVLRPRKDDLNGADELPARVLGEDDPTLVPGGRGSCLAPEAFRFG